MKEKLTLSIEKDTKLQAKRHAKAVGKSVSQIVEELLNEVATEKDFQPEPGSITASLAGSLELPDKYKDKSYKEIKRSILIEKHGE